MSYKKPNYAPSKIKWRFVDATANSFDHYSKKTPKRRAAEEGATSDRTPFRNCWTGCNWDLKSRVWSAFVGVALVVVFSRGVMASVDSRILLLASAEVEKTSDPNQIGNLRLALLQAPERLTIGKTLLMLQASLSANHMPRAGFQNQVSDVTNAGYRPITVDFKLIAENGASLPPGLHVDTAWLLQGSHIWETKAIDETIAIPIGVSRDFVLRDGPKWDSKDSIDVVIRLIDEKGSAFLLASRQRAISAVE